MSKDTIWLLVAGAVVLWLINQQNNSSNSNNSALSQLTGAADLLQGLGGL